MRFSSCGQAPRPLGMCNYVGRSRLCAGSAFQDFAGTGGYQGVGLLIPYCKRRGQARLSPRQEAEDAVHRRAWARVEHPLSRLKNWRILRDCRLKGNGVTRRVIQRDGQCFSTPSHRHTIAVQVGAVHRQLPVPHRLIFSGAGLPKGAP